MGGASPLITSCSLSTIGGTALTSDNGPLSVISGDLKAGRFGVDWEANRAENPELERFAGFLAESSDNGSDKGD